MYMVGTVLGLFVTATIILIEDYILRAMLELTTSVFKTKNKNQNLLYFYYKNLLYFL